MPGHNGDSAFPNSISDGDVYCDGMTLRDYFAAQALTGILAKETGPQTCRFVAVQAYEYAEAMLAERSLIEELEAPNAHDVVEQSE